MIPPPNLARIYALALQIESQGLPTRLDAYGTLFIELEPIKIWIMRRPDYCDRGRWLVHAESTDPALLCIDSADGFPRYYFFDECLIQELTEWIRIRQKQVVRRKGALSDETH